MNEQQLHEEASDRADRSHALQCKRAHSDGLMVYTAQTLPKLDEADGWLLPINPLWLCIQFMFPILVSNLGNMEM